MYSAWQVGWSILLICLLFVAVDPPVLPVKTKALWTRKAGDAPPTARPLAIRGASSGDEQVQEPSSEEVPLRARVTVAKKGAPASKGSFGRSGPVVPPRAAAAPSGVLKRTGPPAGEATSKRARVAPREGTESPDMQSAACAEPVPRSSPVEVSSSPGENQGLSGRRSDKGMLFLSVPLFCTCHFVVCAFNFFVVSAALAEKLLASFPDDVDEAMRRRVQDVEDGKDVSFILFLSASCLYLCC